MKHTERNWNPVRKGAIYCSPACGDRCTHAAFKKAHATAKRMIRSMDEPSKWEARIWENLGWHCSIQRGNIEIHSRGLDGKFCAHYDHMHWESGDTPQEAADAVQDSIRKEIASLRHMLKQF